MILDSFSSGLSILGSVIAVIIFAFILIPMQFKNTVQYPRDGLTRLRYYILICFIISALALIPSVPYQLLALKGTSLPALKDTALIATSIFKVLIPVDLLLIITYVYRSNNDE